MATHITNELKSLFPDTTFTPSDFVPEALIQQIATIASVVEGDTPVVRVPFVSEDPSVGFVKEGAEIPESETGFSEILIHTDKLAVLEKVSREAASYNGAATMIANSMKRALIVKADNALLSNASDPTGLLNIGGIIDGGTMEPEDLDVLSDAITTIEANGATATHIIMDPKSWGVLRKLKTATGSAQLLLGNPAEQTTKQLFGLPVIISNQLPAGTVLVSDKANLIASVGDIQMAKSAEAAFTSDSIYYRLTWRFGFGLIHPDRLAKIAVTVA